jgi:hypothetical protein
MSALHQRYTFFPVFIILMFASGYSKQPQAISHASVSGSLSAIAQNESDIYYGWNNWGNILAFYQARRQAAAAKTVHSNGTAIAADTGSNTLLFGDWDTGTIQQLAGGQLNAYFSDQVHDLGFIRDIQMSGDMVYVSSVERQQEYQMLSRITGGTLDNQWPGLAGGIALLPLGHKQLLSGGAERTIYPYKVNSSLSLPSRSSFPAYTGKSAIKLARNSRGNIYILDVVEGVLYKVECNANGVCDWQNTITLSKDYPRAVQLAIDEQDRIVLGVAGVEIEPSSIPRNNESRIVLLEDMGLAARLLDAKSDKSIRLWFGPRGGLVAANGEVDFISTSDSKDSIVRLGYSDNLFREPEVILSTDKTISGLAVKDRR